MWPAAEEGVDDGTPQVGVDQQDCPIGLREADGEVRDRRGLPLAFPSAGHQQPPDRRIRIRIVQVGPEDSVRLGREGAGVVQDHQAGYLTTLHG